MATARTRDFVSIIDNVADKRYAYVTCQMINIPVSSFRSSALEFRQSSLEVKGQGQPFGLSIL